MASDAFTGSAATALGTHDSNWKAGDTGTNDGITGAELDGSGNLRVTAFKFCDAYYDDGSTGHTSKSHIVIPAGCPIDNSSIISATLCVTSSSQGYQFRIKSTTSVNTNFDRVDLYRNNAFVATRNPTSINANTTALDIMVEKLNTVDLRMTVNGQVLDWTGSGGNDASGSAVLATGFPGVSVWWNAGGASTLLVDSWTDDAGGGGGGYTLAWITA